MAIAKKGTPASKRTSPAKTAKVTPATPKSPEDGVEGSTSKSPVVSPKVKAANEAREESVQKILAARKVQEKYLEHIAREPYGKKEAELNRLKTNPHSDYNRKAQLAAKLKHTKLTQQKQGQAISSFRDATGFRRNADVRVYVNEPPENANSWDMQRWKVAVFMESGPIKAFLVLAIFANAVLIGVEADYGDDSSTWMVLEVIFLIIFTTELVLNIVGFGQLFFGDPWNLMDFFVVLFSLIDFAISVSSPGGSSGLSVVRLVRVVRVIRVISFLEKLVYLVAAFAKGMASAGWVLVLMTLALYIFAVLAKSFFGDDEYLRAELAGSDVDVAELFGTIPKAFITLVQFFTFDDTIGVQRAIGQVYPAAWVYFLIFLVVISMGMLELMTSIFIDSLLEEKAELEKKKGLERSQQRSEVQQLISGLFHTFDTNGSGVLGPAELEAAITFFDDPTTSKLLETVGIDLAMMKESIRLSDLDGNGEVTKDEFEEALESLHAPPTKADIRDLVQRMTELHQNVTVVQGSVEELRDNVEARTSAMEAQMNLRFDRIEQLLGGLPPEGPVPEAASPAQGAPPQRGLLAPLIPPSSPVLPSPHTDLGELHGGRSPPLPSPPPLPARYQAPSSFQPLSGPDTGEVHFVSS